MAVAVTDREAWLGHASHDLNVAALAIEALEVASPQSNAEFRCGVRAIAFALTALNYTLTAAFAAGEPEREEPAEGFDTWACAEIMGHRVRYGYVKTVKRGYRDFVEIRIPSVEAPPEGTWKGLSTEEHVEFYAPSALFAVLPMTEDEVMEALRDQGRPF